MRLSVWLQCWQWVHSHGNWQGDYSPPITNYQTFCRSSCTNWLDLRLCWSNGCHDWLGFVRADSPPFTTTLQVPRSHLGGPQWSRRRRKVGQIVDHAWSKWLVAVCAVVQYVNRLKSMLITAAHCILCPQQTDNFYNIHFATQMLPSHKKYQLSRCLYNNLLSYHDNVFSKLILSRMLDLANDYISLNVIE